MRLASFLLAAAAVVELACASGAAHAQPYPSRSIRFIVPYAAGGLPDTVARMVGQRLAETLGQPVVVDNRTGGSGAVAATALAQAPADGYTFIVTDGPMLATAAVLSSKPAFDAARDFVPVSVIGVAPLYLAVNAKVPANTLDELIALAKRKPGALNYGSSGIGSIHHLTAEAMKAGLGIYVTHIPFRGSAVSVPAMIGGEVEMAFSSPPSLMGFVRSGQAKLIAINSAKRSPLTPNVPALAEKIPGFNFAFNVVLLAKPGTPAEALQKMNAEIAKAVRHPELVEQLQKAGVDPVGGTQEEAVAALRSESQRITAAARHAGLKRE
ncbi:MAG: 4,5-dihydroxyphthalate dehydrogenase [Ramlibacter sp.]|jgi:tripartite-type tricarboxylate transporter receptor subunit TctC|nr:4,5-dihydroxyphthalate dehydrogenase [Ramlibacter sp.]MDB5913775.1 4,5-dihydroxyphthalate dehydrogenase [Ramlibacter sp.]